MSVSPMLNFKTQEPEYMIPADVKTLMEVFTLQPMEAEFLQAMLVSTKWIGKDELPVLKYSIRQVAFKLRAKIEPLGVIILNDGAGRYSIAPASKLVAKTLIEKTLALGVME